MRQSPAETHRRIAHGPYRIARRYRRTQRRMWSLACVQRDYEQAEELRKQLLEWASSVTQMVSPERRAAPDPLPTPRGSQT